MPGFILVVEDEERITHVVESAIEGANVRVLKATSFALAKRKLIQAAPDLIICAVSISSDTTGDGYKFCRDLKEHSELSRIPVILVAEALSGDSIKSATESGASGLMPWPVTPNMLRGRIAPLLPELVEPPPAEAPPPATAPQAPAATSGDTGEAQEKILLAQRLLAQVLHNLKTSDLLQIVDLDDVPRVVSEITRKVCGVQDEPPAPDRGPEQPAAGAETVLDLERAFRLKD